MRRVACVLTLLALAGCAVYLPEPDNRMAGGSEERLKDLRAGRALYVNKCSGCHSLISVDRFDDRKWEEEVGEMLRQKKIRLSPQDHDLLLLYLSTASGR